MRSILARSSDAKEGGGGLQPRWLLRVCRENLLGISSTYRLSPKCYDNQNVVRTAAFVHHNTASERVKLVMSGFAAAKARQRPVWQHGVSGGKNRRRGDVFGETIRRAGMIIFRRAINLMAI